VAIYSSEFLQWLIDQGVVPARTYHVIIDVRVGEPVRMLVEQYPTEALTAQSVPPDLKWADSMEVQGAQLISADDATCLIGIEYNPKKS